VLLFAAENYRDIEKGRQREEDRGSKAAAILMQPVERVEGTAIVVGGGNLLTASIMLRPFSACCCCQPIQPIKPIKG
jgi:hypothetical protein